MMKNVVLVLLYDDEGKFLLQLRDSDPTIAYPGHWGGFGGSLEEGETATVGARREILEELNYSTDYLSFLNSRQLPDCLVDVFSCKLTVPPSELTLMEGLDMGLFSIDQISTGVLYSKTMRQSYPVAAPLRTMCQEFIQSEISTSAD